MVYVMPDAFQSQMKQECHFSLLVEATVRQELRQEVEARLEEQSQERAAFE